MLFISNKYTTWYYSIISLAQTREIPNTYVEKHHIIPKSLGGDDDNVNMVKLTAREHYICHLLLTKMTRGNNRIKMLHALGKFIQNSPYNQRRFSARQYETIRKAISEARTGKKHTVESKLKIGKTRKERNIIPWNKGVTGIVHSLESNRKRSETMKDKEPLTCPHCNKIGKGNVMFRYHFNNCKNL